MSTEIKAVIFDVDGVLLDSLPQHLEICRDKAKEFGLNIEIPTIEQFRHMVSKGTKVSPMRNFFLAVGFPEEFADRALVAYGNEFATKYRPQVFDHVDHVLEALHKAGLILGLVTSNTSDNVAPVLGSSMNYFDKSCVFYYQPGSGAKDKPEALAEAVRALGLDAAACVYIGDQPADVEAARKVGCHILGVTYGWGILKGVHGFMTADSVAAIPGKLECMQSPPDNVTDRAKLQFDYAWKWFEYHADQRVKMFNFMLIVFGILAAAVVGAVDKRLPSFIPLGLCGLATIMALVFARLDTRNKNLVKLGEEELARLEGGLIFRDQDSNKIPSGILQGKDSKDDGESFFAKAWAGQHRILLPSIATLLALTFLLAGLLIWYSQPVENPILH